MQILDIRNFVTSMDRASYIFSTIPPEVIGNFIFCNLSLPDLGICSRVCKVWRELAEKEINTFSHEKAFGPKEWYIHFGTHLKNVPRLPPNINEILFSPCPFWPSKQVHETHLLCLVPQTVNGQPLTLKLLGELVQKPLKGFATRYRYFMLGEYTDPAAPPSHWALLTRDVIEGSRSESYEDQLIRLSKKCHGVYVAPMLLDATVCVFTEYVRTGTRIYSTGTYTRCQQKYNARWQLGVGGCAPDGLRVHDDGGYDDGYVGNGVAGSRKF